MIDAMIVAAGIFDCQSACFQARSSSGFRTNLLRRLCWFVRYSVSISSEPSALGDGCV